MRLEGEGTSSLCTAEQNEPQICAGCILAPCGHAGHSCPPKWLYKPCLPRVAMMAILAPCVAMQAILGHCGAMQAILASCVAMQVLSLLPQVIEGLATTREAYTAGPPSIKE